VVWQRPVVESRPPQRPKRLPLPKIGHLDPGFEEGTSRVGLPVGEQGARPLQHQPAVPGNLCRRCVDQRETGLGSTRSQQLVGGLDNSGRQLGAWTTARA
jgi:hypothetical protein